VKISKETQPLAERSQATLQRICICVLLSEHISEFTVDLFIHGCDLVGIS